MTPLAATAVPVLSEDLLREVFIRLPTAAALLRAALACKPFLRAARNAAFLRRFRALHASSFSSSRPLLLGFLYVVPKYGNPPLFLPAASTATLPPPLDGDFSLSFLPAGDCPSTWGILDCRNGRILLRDRFTKDLAVADPLARAYILLPAAPDADGYGLVIDDSDSPAFRVVCVAQGRRRGYSTLRALVLFSAELYWHELEDLPCDANLAASRAMQANGRLYWRLKDGKRMVALDAAADATMELSVIDLPPFLSESFVVLDTREDDGDGLHLVTMRDFRVERWVAAADGASGRPWTRLEKSVRFYWAMEYMLEQDPREHELVIIGVIDGLMFLRLCGCLLSIDLETMKLSRLSEEDCSPALIYLYTRTRPWPPSFLNPTESGT